MLRSLQSKGHASERGLEGTLVRFRATLSALKQSKRPSENSYYARYFSVLCTGTRLACLFAQGEKPPLAISAKLRARGRRDAGLSRNEIDVGLRIASADRDKGNKSRRHQCR